MLKSINQWSFPQGMTLRQMIQMAKDAGFDAFEPALSERGELSLESSDQDIAAVRRASEEIGLPLCSLASGLYWDYSLTSSCESTRLKAREIVRRQLEAANILGVDTILVVPGTVGCGFWGSDDPVDYDVAYDRALEAMQALKGDAQRLQVAIGVENVWNNFLLSPLEMRDFIDRVDSPWVGAYLDVGNLVKFGYPEMWVKILGRRIKKVHVKDCKRSVATLDAFVDLLSGDVNFPKVVEALRQAGYDGPLTAEMGGQGCYPGDIVYRTARALETILKGN